MYNLNHVERIPRRDGVDEDITMYPDGVLGINWRKFVLTSRIDDMTIVFDALIHHTFSESRFDCRVIGVHEVVLNELLYQR